MGCRPSRHSLGKVGDSTWEYNRAYMQEMDQRKHKNKKSGRGRGRRPPTYNDFSSTSKTYVNNRECKSSKITVRLSTDGSMLEIETFDVDLNGRGETSERVQDSSSDIVDDHAVEKDGKGKLQRCESAPELISKSGSNAEPVVWKSWTKVPNTESCDVEDKFTCVDTELLTKGVDHRLLYEVNGHGWEGCIQIGNDYDMTTSGSHARYRNDEHIPTPEADQICDIFLKKAIITQDIGGYESIVKMPQSRHTCICRESISKEFGDCAYPSPEVGFSVSGCNCKEQDVIRRPMSCNTSSLCHYEPVDDGGSNPARPSSCDALTCLVLYGKSKIEPPTQLCCLCVKSAAGDDAQGTNFALCEHTSVKPDRHRARCQSSEISNNQSFQNEGEMATTTRYSHRNVPQISRNEAFEKKHKAKNIDRHAVKQTQEDSVNCKAVCNCVPCSCTNKTKNGFHNSATHIFPFSCSSQSDNYIIGQDLENLHRDSRTCNFDETVSMTTSDKIIEGTEDGCGFLGTTIIGETANAVKYDDSSSKHQSWPLEDLAEIEYDDCGEIFNDKNSVLATYNFDFLDISEGETDSDEEYAYESSEDQDIDNERVEFQDPFDNIPTITRAYEGYSAVYDDDVMYSSVGDDDDSDEIYIDAVESSYV